MDQKYKKEPLITLSEARKLSGYTSDHLAYLCRKGYLVSERHGRIWLTCRKAIEDYQASLGVAGKPVAVEDQVKVLRSDRIPGMSKVFKIIKEAVQAFAADLTLSFKRFANNPLKPPLLVPETVAGYRSHSIDALGFTVGLPPVRLPIAEVPTYITPRSITGHAVAACFSIAMLILVLQGLNVKTSNVIVGSIDLAERTITAIVQPASEALQFRFETPKPALSINSIIIAREDKEQPDLEKETVSDSYGIVAGQHIEPEVLIHQQLPVVLSDDTNTEGPSVQADRYIDTLTIPDVLYVISQSGTQQYIYQDVLNAEYRWVGDRD